jgi:pilus assembly protein CpaB
MRSRGLVVVLALILATLATVGVFLYSRGVKEDALETGDIVEVIVSKVDIPANSDLNRFIEDGQFELLQLPSAAVVEDAITDISQLRNRRNSVFILAGEQIPLSRVEGGEVPGGQLGIPEGHQAVTVELDAPRAIAGALAGGDNVTIYATFEDIDLTLLAGGRGQTVEKLIQSLIRQQRQQQQTTQQQGQQVEIPSFDATVVLVPEVEVLRVIREVRRTNVPGQEESAGEENVGGNVSVTLAFLPEEAQRFVFALELGEVYLSLLPPDQAGVDLGSLTVAQIILPEKQK